MKTAEIKPNQSPLDMVLMTCGTLEGALQIMANNEESLTSNPASGAQYKIPDDVTTDVYAVQYMTQNKIVIGTKG